MSNKYLALILLIILVLIGFSGCSKQVTNKKPKLIVQITIDGLRDGLLERYDPAFKYGFRKLLDEGLIFPNASVNHAITVSPAGHTSIATGNNPNKHGIVDAAFYVTEGKERMLVDYSADSTENIVGFPDLTGVSPHRIFSSSIAEWVTDNNLNSKSLVVGSGSRKTMLYSNERNKDVYWYTNGKYVTSSYYKKEYPNWVKKFNEEIIPEMMENSRVWNNIVPQKYKHLSRPDTAYFEGDKVNTTFPHLVENELTELLGKDPERAMNIWFRWTPINDIATLKLAQMGIDSLSLGQREAADYIAILLNMIDSNSHYYGPLSMEIFDSLLKIDKALGVFIDHLDKKVGRENYVLAVTADHGQPKVIEYKQRTNKSARRLNKEEISHFFTEIEKAANGYPDLSEEANKRIVETAENFDFIADAYTYAELSSKEEPNDNYLKLYKNSFRKDRIPRLPIFSLETGESPAGKAGVMLRQKEHVMPDLGVNTHGSVYEYDRNVPLIFFGNQIKAGKEFKQARTIDVSPTLSEIAGIPVPTNVDGKSLLQN